MSGTGIEGGPYYYGVGGCRGSQGWGCFGFSSQWGFSGCFGNYYFVSGKQTLDILCCSCTFSCSSFLQSSLSSSSSGWSPFSFLKILFLNFLILLLELFLQNSVCSSSLPNTVQKFFKMSSKTLTRFLPNFISSKELSFDHIKHGTKHTAELYSVILFTLCRGMMSFTKKLSRNIRVAQFRGGSEWTRLCRVGRQSADYGFKQESWGNSVYVNRGQDRLERKRLIRAQLRGMGTGDEVGVVDVLQILVILFYQVVHGLSLLLNRYTFPEYPFLIQELSISPQTHNQCLQDERDTDLTDLLSITQQFTQSSKLFLFSFPNIFCRLAYSENAQFQTLLNCQILFLGFLVYSLCLCSSLSFSLPLSLLGLQSTSLTSFLTPIKNPSSTSTPNLSSFCILSAQSVLSLISPLTVPKTIQSSVLTLSVGLTTMIFFKARMNAGLIDRMILRKSSQRDEDSHRVLKQINRNENLGRGGAGGCLGLRSLGSFYNYRVMLRLPNSSKNHLQTYRYSFYRSLSSWGCRSPQNRQMGLPLMSQPLLCRM